MGIFKPIFSENGPNIEFALLEVLDLQGARDAAVYDDLTGTLFMQDRGDGVGERVRPTVQHVLRAKVSSAPQVEDQMQDQVGDDPDSKLVLTLYEEDLLEAGLLENGAPKIPKGSRLLKLYKSDGIGFASTEVRKDFTSNGQPGLRCHQIRPGLTGEGLWFLHFEHIQESAT